MTKPDRMLLIEDRERRLEAEGKPSTPPTEGEIQQMEDAMTEAMAYWEPRAAFVRQAALAAFPFMLEGRGPSMAATWAVDAAEALLAEVVKRGAL